MESYKTLSILTASDSSTENLARLERACYDAMNDDFNTAKVMANMFELVPVINSLKEGLIKSNAFTSKTIQLLQTYFKNYLENILGLKSEQQQDDGKLNGVLQLLIDMRKEAKGRKDYATSDTIRNQLTRLGILLKDEKDGNVSISFE